MRLFPGAIGTSRSVLRTRPSYSWYGPRQKALADAASEELLERRRPRCAFRAHRRSHTAFREVAHFELTLNYQCYAWVIKHGFPISPDPLDHRNREGSLPSACGRDWGRRANIFPPRSSGTRSTSIALSTRPQEARTTREVRWDTSGNLHSPRLGSSGPSFSVIRRRLVKRDNGVRNTIDTLRTLRYLAAPESDMRIEEPGGRTASS